MRNQKENGDFGGPLKKDTPICFCVFQGCPHSLPTNTQVRTAIFFCQQESAGFLQESCTSLGRFAFAGNPEISLWFWVASPGRIREVEFHNIGSDDEPLDWERNLSPWPVQRVWNGAMEWVAGWVYMC